ncbi:MAG: DUF2993 domain-containing protein [Coleofasciculus sp. S288]|nr:DUF2993 domain-containing protein [Coleofasciculus sp. S288]
MSDEPRLDEQALSEAAEMALSRQLDEVENIDVDLRTNLLKLVQGQADSVSIVGQGLVVQKDIRLEEVELHAPSIAVNLLSVILGEIELNQPVDATVRLVLTEQDINQALQSDYIRSKWQGVELKVDSQSVTLEPQQLEVQLPGGGRIGLRGTVLLHERGKTQRIGFTAVIRPRLHWQSLLLEAFQCTEGEGVSLELAIAALNQVKELINLPHFDLEGIALYLKELEVQKGRLTVYAKAYIQQFPKLNVTAQSS